MTDIAILLGAVAGVSVFALSGNDAFAAPLPASGNPDTSREIEPFSYYDDSLVLNFPLYNEVFEQAEPISYPDLPTYAPVEPETELVIPSPDMIPSPVVPDVSVNDFYSANLNAFLTVIRIGESTDNYFAKVGGGNFANFDDHPTITGEFAGIRRADGRLTTAAGAYQIVVTTWKSLGGRAKYGNFSPASQDQAAIDLIIRRGAYDLVLQGKIAIAASKLANEWEMFKTARWSFTNVAKVFTGAGGSIA